MSRQTTGESVRMLKRYVEQQLERHSMADCHAEHAYALAPDLWGSTECALEALCDQSAVKAVLIGMDLALLMVNGADGPVPFVTRRH